MKNTRPLIRSIFLSVLLIVFLLTIHTFRPAWGQDPTPTPTEIPTLTIPPPTETATPVPPVEASATSTVTASPTTQPTDLATFTPIPSPTIETVTPTVAGIATATATITTTGTGAATTTNTASPTVTATPNTWTTYSDRDLRLQYSGNNWQSFAVNNAAGGTLTGTDVASATLHIQFSGTAIALLYSAGPEGGDFALQLDANTPVMANNFAPNYGYGLRLEWTALAEGLHTLTITNGVNALWVEAIEIQGVLIDASRQIAISDGITTVNGPITNSLVANAETGTQDFEDTIYTDEVIPTLITTQPMGGFIDPDPLLIQQGVEDQNQTISALAYTETVIGGSTTLQLVLEMAFSDDSTTFTLASFTTRWFNLIVYDSTTPLDFSSQLTYELLRVDGSVIQASSCQRFANGTNNCNRPFTFPGGIPGVHTIRLTTTATAPYSYLFYGIAFDDFSATFQTFPTATPVPTATAGGPTSVPTEGYTGCKVEIAQGKTIYAFDYPDELKVYLDRNGERRLLPGQPPNVNYTEYVGVIDPNSVSQIAGYRAAFTEANWSELTIDAYYLKRQLSIVRAIKAKNTTTMQEEDVDFWFYAGNGSVGITSNCPNPVGLNGIPIYPDRAEAIQILENYQVFIAEDSYNWSDQELREAIISIQRVATSYEIAGVSGASKEAIFKQKMITSTVLGITLVRLSGSEPVASSYSYYYDTSSPNSDGVNNGNCKTYVNGYIVCRGSIDNGNMVPPPTVGEITEYTITHELGHHFDNLTNRELQNSLDTGGNITIPDCNTKDSTVLGEYPGFGWVRGLRGWGSLGFSSFQQNPLPQPTPTEELYETSGDMYLNWVYRITSDDLPDSGFCDTNTPSSHSIVGNWEGFLNIWDEPNSIDSNGILDFDDRLPGNARYIWMHAVMLTFL